MWLFNLDFSNYDKVLFFYGKLIATFYNQYLETFG